MTNERNLYTTGDVYDKKGPELTEKIANAGGGSIFVKSLIDLAGKFTEIIIASTINKQQGSGVKTETTTATHSLRTGRKSPLHEHHK